MPHPKIHVLLALRDAAHVAPLAQALMHSNASVALASLQSVEGLLDRLEIETPSLLILELHNGATFLEKVRAQYPQLPIVAVLEKPTAQLSFAASRLGAEDVLTLPLDETETAERMQAVLDKIAQSPSVPPDMPRNMPGKAALPGAVSSPAAAAASKSAPANAAPVPALRKEETSRGKEDSGKEGNRGQLLQLIGSNPRMAEIRDLVGKVATTDATVLIRGESGVGKEIVARMIFESSRRAQKPFVKVNCAAIPNDLLESELFGYDVGAFTGATRQKPGKFEQADTGTLFLDEIGEMHPMLQAKLLHVLQDGRFSRLGAKHDISVDVRVLCATNKLLEQRVAEGLFREDLYYRINVVTIQIPPLRERRDEIPLLTRYFLEKYAAEYRRPLRLFSPEAERQMLAYIWPGNIRELENLCKRFVIVGGETQILRELSQRQPMETAPIAESTFASVPASASRSMSGAWMSDAESQNASRSRNRQLEAANTQNKNKNAARAEQTQAVEAGPSLLEIGRNAAWQAERQAIQQMLLQTRWNRREAAKRLQVSYKALLNKIKQMELESSEETGSAPGEE
ncbi:MAG TPA: sigma-54 dependent transcriptional regulator [Acidobacteriaceae bacterium]|jgi:DNA-binding NtrC family response regulator|nr:sigma-54 dependent transcriptional regulator [Acidobacteriaceae bacterium]